MRGSLHSAAVPLCGSCRHSLAAHLDSFRSGLQLCIGLHGSGPLMRLIEVVHGRGIRARAAGCRRAQVFRERCLRTKAKNIVQSVRALQLDNNDFYETNDLSKT